MTIGTNQYKYYAFVSYRGTDVKWAKWFVKSSDNFLIPTITAEEVKGGIKEPARLKKDDKYLYPVFRDRDNLMSGHLLSQILEAIDTSKKIVVLCSPNAAKSGSWMDDELNHIINSGRISNIIPLVVDGRIYSIEEYEAAGRSIEDPFEDDSNPYILRRYMKEHRDHSEGINYVEFEEQGIHDIERAFIKCVASIIEMPFESLWDRFGKEQKRKKRLRLMTYAAATITTITVALATWMYNQPVDVQMKLVEATIHNDNLPELRNAIVTMTLDNEVKSDTVANITDIALFANVPHEAMGKEVRLTVTCDNWTSIDTTLVLTKETTLAMNRDIHPFGDVTVRLWNPTTEQFVPDVTLSIEGMEATSDEEGKITMFIPLERQKVNYEVKSSIPLEENTLTLPTTQSTVLIVK